MQLANISPVAAEIVSKVLAYKPTIGNKFSWEQVEAIFLKPLVAVSGLLAANILAFVIDGVDELEPGEAKKLPAFYADLTLVLSKLAAELPKNVRLLVLSRPEAPIISNLPPHIKHSDLATNHSVHDVRRYLAVELRQLGKRHGLPDFPTLYQEELLCSAAAGHLGWARQAGNWLDYILEYEGSGQLEVLVETIGEAGSGDLDDLYTRILHHSLPSVEPARSRYTAGLSRVLRCLATLEEPQTIATISRLLEPHNGFDIFNCFKRLSSLYARDHITPATIPQPHKSFYDFVTIRAPLEFRVDRALAHRELASTCLRIMQDELHFNMGGFDSPKLDNADAPFKVPAYVAYACSSFVSHVRGSGEPFLEEIRSWARNLFLFWLEVMGLENCNRQANDALESFMTDNTKVLRSTLFLHNLYCSPLERHRTCSFL
jgi:hypothetical protein